MFSELTKPLSIGWLLCTSLSTLPVLAQERPGNPGRGADVYRRYCITCHGERGDGAGEFAPYTVPKPRDFRQGTFKWRSTPSGSLPLVSDLEHTIRNGVYWTAMPSFFPLSERARRDVIAYIQTFSPRWKSDEAAMPLQIAPEPAHTPESVAKGRTVYEKQNCAQCHGDGGAGDGPAAKTETDDWGNPILPFDLTKGHMKGGTTGADLYRVFMTGLNGTPMPSFSESIAPDEAWDLVHYIQSLAVTRPGAGSVQKEKP
ncbi:MAG TPA: c-type cytochrome [Vicinamibacterales bacterium]|jgi:mono/diheme cytochrome c family protein|nr:c-type cytochrome [Vicinamibacterales bacterium]